MPNLISALRLLPLIAFLPVLALAQPNGANLLPKEEVEQVFQQGLARLAEGRTVSDIVARHINVGEEYMGVSVVQRSKKDIGTDSASISHVDLDEIYYIVTGEGTMITGGTMPGAEATTSELLGNGHRGTITGGVLQKMRPGDIAIIPKGMPHGWHEITTDSIGYLIFRADPNKVMQEKTE
ncbi:MAG: cupin domain-containing protein [Pseudohongiellaceae bacterium]